MENTKKIGEVEMTAAEYAILRAFYDKSHGRRYETTIAEDLGISKDEVTEALDRLLPALGFDRRNHALRGPAMRFFAEVFEVEPSSSPSHAAVPKS